MKPRTYHLSLHRAKVDTPAVSARVHPQKGGDSRMECDGQAQGGHAEFRLGKHARAYGLGISPQTGCTPSALSRDTNDRCGRRSYKWLAVVAIVIAGLGSRAAADGPSSNLVAEVRTVQDLSASGELVSLSREEGVVIRTALGIERQIPIDDVVRVVALKSEVMLSSSDVTIGLAGGDRIVGSIESGNAESVTLRSSTLNSISIPLDAILGFRSGRASGSAFRESAEWFETSSHAGEDSVLLTNGDVLGGFVTGIGADGVSIEGSFGESKLAHRVVIAVRMVPSSMRSAAPQRRRFVIMLRDGTRLTVANLTLSSKRAEARLSFGPEVVFDSSSIAQVNFFGGRWKWLSSLRPISYHHTPMLSLNWEYQDNRNVTGGPITVQGERFDFGVGVHSRSSLTYDLKGEFRWFVTAMGIDDDSGDRADVSVSLLVDGQRRFRKDHVRHGTLHGPVRIDVTKGNRLELVVDFGDNGDIQDRFNWIDAGLIR